MTTLIPFTPSSTSNPPFSVSVPLDNANYALSCRWNLYRTGWYYTLTDQNQNDIVTRALVGSPIGYDIYLASGFFAVSTLLYRSDTGNFEVNP